MPLLDFTGFRFCVETMGREGKRGVGHEGKREVGHEGKRGVGHEGGGKVGNFVRVNGGRDAMVVVN